MNAAFLHNSCQNWKSSDAQSNPHEQTERQELNSLWGKLIVHIIRQANTKRKRNHYTRMANHHRFIGFVF